MAPNHPDWSGLQAVEVEPAQKEATLTQHEQDLQSKLPLEFFNNDKKDFAPSSLRNYKVLSVEGSTEGLNVDVEEKQLHETRSMSDKLVQQDPAEVAARKRSRRRLYVLIGLILFIIALAVAIPCGVLLSQKAKNGPPVPSASDGANSSGPAVAHNGTRLSTVQPAVGNDNLWLYWQNENGDIRLSKLNSSNQWEDSINIPTTQAAPALGTPLAAVIHYLPLIKTGLNHLVYYTKDGYYADVINDPAKDDNWTDGGLYALQRSGAHDPHFNMAWAVQANGTAYLYNAGPRSGSYNMFTYNAIDRTWGDQAKIFIDTSAYGGIVVVQENLLSAMRIVGLDQSITNYYRDESAGGNGKWTHDAQHTLPGLHSNSSLTSPHLHGDPSLVYYQAKNGSIGIAQLANLNANSAWSSQSDLNIPAMAMSSLQVAVIGSSSTYLFLQENGNDLSYYTGSAADLSKAGTLPI